MSDGEKVLTLREQDGRYLCVKRKDQEPIGA